MQKRLWERKKIKKREKLLCSAPTVKLMLAGLMCICKKEVGVCACDEILAGLQFPSGLAI